MAIATFIMALIYAVVGVEVFVVGVEELDCVGVFGSFTFPSIHFDVQFIPQ